MNTDLALLMHLCFRSSHFFAAEIVKGIPVDGILERAPRDRDSFVPGEKDEDVSSGSGEFLRGVPVILPFAKRRFAKDSAFAKRDRPLAQERFVPSKKDRYGKNDGPKNYEYQRENELKKDKYDDAESQRDVRRCLMQDR